MYIKICLIICFKLFTNVISSYTSSERPNILLFLVDDMGWNDVGFHGNNEVSTPNLDSLAYNGVVLNNHYSQALCTPSRGALLTGKHPIHLGLQHSVIFGNEPRGLSLKETLLPEVLKKKANYATHMIGKWHLGYYRKEFTPTYRGFDSHFGFWNGFQDYYTHTHQTQSYTGYDMRNNMDIDYESLGIYSTDLVTDKAINVIKKHNQSVPLFLYVAHGAPHAGNPSDPFQAPDEIVHKFRHIKDPFRRKYLAMVYKLDESMGRIVRSLRDHQMLQNTVIVFLSDNGAQPLYVYANRGSNYPLRGMKESAWEGATRTLGIVWSTSLKQKVFTELMHITDWFPTICSIANVKIDESVDGINLWPAISTKGPEMNLRREMLYNIDDIDGIEAIRSLRWKYINGNVENGSFDGWYAKNDITKTSYNIDAVLNSKVSQIFNSLITNRQILVNDISGPIELNLKVNEEFLDAETVSLIRKKATVVCDNIPNATKKEICNPCLFDLRRDPCEVNNLAANHTDLVEYFQNRLKFWRLDLVEPQNVPLDQRGIPYFWNNTWTNWYDLLEDSRSSSTTIFNIHFIILFFTILLLFL